MEKALTHEIKKLEEQQLERLKILSTGKVTSTFKSIIEANNSEKYFRNYEKSDTEQVKKSIIKIYIGLGIKGTPTDLEIQELMIFMKAHFKTNTFSDLELAIDLNAARKLENYHQHYQLLNTDFVGAILTDYNELLRKANVELAKARENAIESSVKLPEAANSSYLMIKNYFQENKAFPMAANWSSAFDWMWSNGLTEDKETMADWFLAESEKVKREIIDSMFWAKNVVEKRAIEMQLEGNYVKMECRKRYVQKMIGNLESF